jgi:hypothetical protein
MLLHGNRRADRWSCQGRWARISRGDLHLKMTCVAAGPLTKLLNKRGKLLERLGLGRRRRLGAVGGECSVSNRPGKLDILPIKRRCPQRLRRAPTIHSPHTRANRVSQQVPRVIATRYIQGGFPLSSPMAPPPNRSNHSRERRGQHFKKHAHTWQSCIANQRGSSTPPPTAGPRPSSASS